MKITDVKVWLVQGIKYNWTLLKIYTDEGYTGVGEATNWPGSPIVFEAAKHVGQRIIGLDPMKTDFIWTKLYRDLNWIGPYGASLCAISGIDMALLDLKAKVLGVPCYELLGGAYRKDIHNITDHCGVKFFLYQSKQGLIVFPFFHCEFLFTVRLSTCKDRARREEDTAVKLPVAYATRNRTREKVEKTALSISSLPAERCPFVV